MQDHKKILDIYVRVSRLGDPRQRSIEGQIADCTARVHERGAELGITHDLDRGKSAWNPRVKRPSWDHLMDRLESGATNGVIVWDLARFSRRPIEGERLILAAERGLVVLDSEGEYDLSTPSGKKAFRDQVSTAAYESDRLSTRVRRGKRVRAMNGEPNGSGRPFGFEVDGITLRQNEAVILREVADRLLAGEPQNELVRALNDAGIETTNCGEWRRSTLCQTLVRPRNAGLITYKGEVVARARGETIFSEEVHERLISLLTSRRRGRPTSGLYLLSGIAGCPCGWHLTGMVVPHKRPYSDGSPARVYWCQPRAESGGGCAKNRVDQRALDEHVRVVAVEILADPKHAAAVEAAARDLADRRAVLESELAECEQLAEELAGRLGRGEITLKRHDAAARPLDRRIARAQRDLDALGEPVGVVPSAAAVAASRAEWYRRWDAGTVSEQRGLVLRALAGKRLVVKPEALARRFDPRRVHVIDPDGA